MSIAGSASVEQLMHFEPVEIEVAEFHDPQAVKCRAYSRTMHIKVVECSQTPRDPAGDTATWPICNQLH
jgi:hypothetical protein